MHLAGRVYETPALEEKTLIFLILKLLQVCFKKNSAGDGFVSYSESESFGRTTWEEKYTDEGLTMVKFSENLLAFLFLYLRSQLCCVVEIILRLASFLLFTFLP
jgi:hypothetical protein